MIRVPREAWERMRSFALNAGRDIREATAAAMDEYITKQTDRNERLADLLKAEQKK